MARITPIERTILMGVGAAAAGGLIVAMFTTNRLRRGLPLVVTFDPPTRNLVDKVSNEWTTAINHLTTTGVPVQLDLIQRKPRGKT